MAVERETMVLAIVLVIIGVFFLVPLLPQVKVKLTYKTALRIYVGLGFFSLVLMVICRCLFPQIFAPIHRAYEWSDGSVLVQVSLRLSYFFSLMAAGFGLLFLWVEYRFYRLAPNQGDHRHLLADIILVAVYLGSYVAFIQLW